LKPPHRPGGANGRGAAAAAALTQNAGVKRLRDMALERFGQVDILVNALGITGPT
jgi:NAD(P)-dependent dehydrogenase (short-subunit alcohol dehydrogenase family)